MSDFAMGFVTAWALMIVAGAIIFFWCLCDTKDEDPTSHYEDREHGRR